MTEWDIDEATERLRAANEAARSTRKAKAPRKRRKPIAVLRVEQRGETPLLPVPVDHPSAYSTPRPKPEPIPEPPRRLPDPPRSTKPRCPDDDHWLVARHGRAVCPYCGQVFGTVDLLRKVMELFPGTTLVGEA